MSVPITVLVILILAGLFSRSLFKTANRPLFLILIMMVLLAMSGLRANTVGADTMSYYQKFVSQLDYSFAQVRVAAAGQKEPEFYIFSWAFGKLIPDAHVWFMFVSLVFLVGVSLVCYWESPDYSLSMLYLYCMGLFFFSMTGVRQALAMGIIIPSYYFLVKRKLIPFILLVFLASRLHRSALVFLLAYPIANLKAGWVRLLIALLVFIIVISFRNSIGAWMLSNIPDQLFDARLNGYINSTAKLTASGFVIQFLMMLFCLRYRKAVVAETPHREALYNIASVGLISQAAAMSIAEFFRISMYFNWSFMLLIPICLQHEAEKSGSHEFLRMAIIVALIAYFLYSTLYSAGIVPYTFFWAESVIK